MLHAVCEAYHQLPSERIGFDPVEDRTLALVFDSEVLSRARIKEKKMMDDMRDGIVDRAGSEEVLVKDTKGWIDSLPEGDMKRNLESKMGLLVNG